MRYVLLTSLTTLFALLGCATTSSCLPIERDLAALFYSEVDDSQNFKNAIVFSGYHETTIAPAQIVDAPPLTFFPSQLRFADRTCVSSARINRQLDKGTFMLVSGRGHYAEGDADRTILLRDPRSNETTFAYDDRGNLMTERPADGAVKRQSR